jgi:hypothetical protein
VAFIVMLFTAIGFFTLSTTVPPRKELAILSPSVYRNKAYSTFLVGASLCVLAIYAPFTFGVTYATSRGVPVGIANYAPAISNGVSIIGRTVPLIVAARTGPINVLMTFAIASGVMQMFWTLTKTTPTIMVYLGIYGITSGGYGASLNPGAASFAPHVNQVGTPIQFSPKLPLTCTRLGCISACASSPRPGSGWLARRSSPSSSTIIPTTCPPLCLAGVS